MADLKTKPTSQSVQEFLNALPDEKRRQECITLLELMSRLTGAEAEMWGSSMVGFGRYKYRYASGHTGETFLLGFAPRKNELTVYPNSYLENFAPILARLGKHKTGKGCLYLKRLEDVDLQVLEELLSAAMKNQIGKVDPV